MGAAVRLVCAFCEYDIIHPMAEKRTHSDTEISDEKIRELWADPTWPSAFAGSLSMQVALKDRLGVDIPTYRILRALSEIPTFTAHQPLRRSFPKLKYYVHSFATLIQLDTAHMPKFNGYSYFVCAVDIYREVQN